MSNKPLTISTAIIILPVAHLIAAAVWIWGWNTGFGSDVAMFSDARDVFSLSVSDLMLVYAGGLLMPLVMFAGGQNNKEIASAEEDLEGENIDKVKAEIDHLEKVLFRLKFTSYSIAFLIVAGGVWGAVATIDSVLRGEPLGMSVVFLIFLPICLPLLGVVKLPDMKNPQVILVLIAVGLFLNAMSSGVMAGQVARHSAYLEASKRSPSCEMGVVLRRLGDHFVVVQQDGRKMITDMACEPLMTVPLERPLADRHFRWTPYPHVEYVAR